MAFLFKSKMWFRAHSCKQNIRSVLGPNLLQIDKQFHRLISLDIDVAVVPINETRAGHVRQDSEHASWHGARCGGRVDPCI